MTIIWLISHSEVPTTSFPPRARFAISSRIGRVALFRFVPADKDQRSFRTEGRRLKLHIRLSAVFTFFTHKTGLLLALLKETPPKPQPPTLTSRRPAP